MTLQATFDEQRSVATPEQMHDLGVALGKAARAGDLIILSGALGAGKTTLSRGLGEGLGVRGPITSPTFVIARTHPSVTGRAPLVHVDAYRLAGPEEFEDLDIDFDGSVVIVEWGEDVVPPGNSWLEIRLERPRGATATGPQGSEPSAHSSELSHSGVSPQSDDGAHADDEEPIEPRTVRITGFGPRWQKGLFA